MIRLSPQAHNVVRSCFIENDVVRITDGELERDLYLEVASAFKNIGGKFDRKINGFRFDRSFHANFMKFRDSGVFDKKEALDFYATPEHAAKYAVDSLSLFTMEHNYQAFLLRDNPGRPFRLLEPSAGHGALVKAFAEKFKEKFPLNPLVVDCVELDPYNAELLHEQGYNVAQEDFLQFRAPHEYDLVLMNPPFSLKGLKDCYVDHVNHALSMITSDAELFAIVPDSLLTAKDEKRNDLLARLLRSCGEVDSEGPFSKKDTFSSSGANVSTVGLRLTKTAHPDFLPPIDLHTFEVELLHGRLSDEFYTLKSRVERMGDKASSIDSSDFESMASFVKEAVNKGVYVDRNNLTPFYKIVSDSLELDTRKMYPSAKKESQFQLNF